MAIYTYTGNRVAGDNTTIIVTLDAAGILREVKRNEAIDLTTNQYNALNATFTWSAGGSTMAKAAAITPSVGYSVPVYYNPVTQSFNVPISGGGGISLPILQSDVTGLVAALAAKADSSALTSGLAAKADSSAVTSSLATKADLASPVFTGNPTAPTPLTADNDTSIATTAFVKAAIGAGGGGITLPIAESDVTNLVTDLAAKAPLASPVFTGDPTAPTPSAADNDTSIATTAFVKTAISALAALASPVFTGDPKAPTPLAGDNDTSIATTAFVTTAVSTAVSTKADSSTVTSGLAAKADLASPTLTGDPKAPTPLADDNDTSIATTAFVTAAIAADKEPMPFTFTQPGALTVKTGGVPFPVPVACTVQSVRAAVGTAPTGAAILVDVNKNGTTIFTTQANRPSIAVSTTSSSAATPAVTALAAGDLITVDIDQIGSTVAGSDLVVVVYVLV